MEVHVEEDALLLLQEPGGRRLPSGTSRPPTEEGAGCGTVSMSVFEDKNIFGFSRNL